MLWRIFRNCCHCPRCCCLSAVRPHPHGEFTASFCIYGSNPEHYGALYVSPKHAEAISSAHRWWHCKDYLFPPGCLTGTAGHIWTLAARSASDDSPPQALESEREKPSFLTWQFHGSRHCGWNQNLLVDVYHWFRCNVLRGEVRNIAMGVQGSPWLLMYVDSLVGYWPCDHWHLSAVSHGRCFWILTSKLSSVAPPIL